MTKNLRAAFERDGYLILPGFVDGAACDALKGRMVEAFEPDEVATIFSTTEKTHAQDAYFLESGDKIRFFFEEEAFDREGRLRQAKEASINKVGHALHDLDPVFDGFSRAPALAELVKALGLQAALLLQSMYIFKQPRIGGEVICHQDATFLHTEPQSVVGLWFALEDATKENGCLWAEPGGHEGPLRSRFIRNDRGTEMIELDSTPLPTEGLAPLEVERGSLVVLHGLLPHWSAPNRSASSRHAYALHVIDGEAHYSRDNWLQRAEDMPLRGF
ncbi:MAG: phytanoyl-CoA dioxygenase family protein [Alphaproteobacteria bacterium]|nr:phytanoyl-CoA dioxygenase family protein [Alphaproteobacteria bacterium]